MKNSIIIATSNSSYDEKGECNGGYNEIHEIICVRDKNHILDTIESIIKLNIKYSSCKIEDITISFPGFYKDLEFMEKRIRMRVSEIDEKIDVYVEEYYLV